MKPEDINNAIATDQGWTKTQHWWWSHPTLNNGCQPDPPDYCNDLNAMHEVVKLLSEEDWEAYFSYLPVEIRSGVEATARERAEAFLKTKGLWEEEK
jgi:hypothetical protein